MPTPRYIPLPIASPVPRYRIGSEIVTSGSITNASIGTVPRHPTYVISFPGYVAMIVAALVLGVLVAIVVFLLIRSPGGSSSAIYVPLHRVRGSGSRAPYVYRGVAALLREMLLELRNRFRCPTCTPSEVAYLSRCLGIEVFVEAYHEVVYGGRRPRDISIVREVVERCVSG